MNSEETTMAPETIEPVRAEVHVPLTPDQAFALFTDGIGEWWPTGSHSIAGHDVAGVVLEGRAGGDIYEVTAGGIRHAWGEVLVYQPAERVILRWHPNPGQVAATEVEVVFTADGDGTRVSVEHRGWERLGERAHAARTSYASATGWPQVLACYQGAA